MGLFSWVADAIGRGEYDDETDYCNQNGLNYDDIYDNSSDDDDD